MSTTSGFTRVCKQHTLGTEDVESYSYDFTADTLDDSGTVVRTITGYQAWTDPDDLVIKDPPGLALAANIVTAQVETPKAAQQHHLWFRATFTDGAVRTRGPIGIGGQKRAIQPNALTGP